MARENDNLTSLLQQLLEQQKTIRQLHDGLKKEKGSNVSVHEQGRTIPKAKPENERVLNVTERCTYNWVTASEFDVPNNGKVYTDEEIEDLEVFRKSHFSECHNQGPSFVTSNSSPPPKSSLNNNHLSSLDHQHNDTMESYSIENYTLNNRMFPALSSAIPSTNDDQEETTTKRLLQISIPTENLKTDYTFKPRNKKCFDSVNTMGLSKHCIKGFNTVRGPVMPVQQFLSINSSIKRANNS